MATDATEIANRERALREELSARDWSSLAWACLRRNRAYRRALKRVAKGVVSARAVGWVFGIAKIKPAHEKADEGQAPKFVPVRVLSCANGKVAEEGVDLRRRRIAVRSDQLLVVISLRHDLASQWAIARAVIEARADSSRSDVPCRNLRTVAVTTELLVHALVAFDLATAENWGPARIGKAMFPGMRNSAATGKARDLIERGSRFVEAGYLRLAMQSFIAKDEMVTESARKPTKRTPIKVEVKSQAPANETHRSPPQNRPVSGGRPAVPISMLIARPRRDGDDEE